MSKSTATHQFMKAQAWALRQHERVRDVATICKKPPFTVATGMRSALGLLDPDDGAVSQIIIVRYCDPGDADDHQMYWPTTVSDRFRWNSAGLVLDMVQAATHEQYDAIADAIYAEAERLKQ